jgi:hypothetical protein
MDKEFMELKIVLLAYNDGDIRILNDNATSLPKQFIYKTNKEFITDVLNSENAKEDLVYNLSKERFFWEWLEDIELVEMIRILNIDFTYNGKDYSFAYLSEDDLDQNWIEAQLYDEEFGMHSEYDTYQSHYWYDEKNKEYYI